MNIGEKSMTKPLFFERAASGAVRSRVGEGLGKGWRRAQNRSGGLLFEPGPGKVAGPGGPAQMRKRITNIFGFPGNLFFVFANAGETSRPRRADSGVQE